MVDSDYEDDTENSTLDSDNEFHTGNSTVDSDCYEEDDCSCLAEDDDQVNDAELNVDEFDDNSVGNRKKVSFTVATTEDIQNRQEDEVSCVSSVLSISKEIATLLLIHFNWVVADVQEEWFADEKRVRDRVGLVPVARLSSNPRSKLRCRICFEVYEVDGMMSSAACGHFFCNTCWRSHISISINDGPGCLILRCPDPACNAAVGESLIKLVSEEDEKKYRTYLMRSYVENSKKIKWCPAPDCDKAIEHGLGVENYDVTCGCKHSFCWNCLEETHRPADCETVAKWNSKNNSEGENVNWILANSKPCPKCKKPIEKNQGCMHMTCIAPCRYEFCWLCLGPWTGHERFFHCNKYEAAKREGKFTVEENKRRAAKESLERYAHYYERWAANESSRKKSLVQLEEWRSVMLCALSEAQKVPETCIDYILEAWVQIIECRRILKWAYAYGYYIPLEERVKRNFFEFMQGEAEAALERLHRCAEVEVLQFMNNEESPSQVEVLQSEIAESPSKELADFRVKLLGLRDVTRTYFENLVRELETGLADVGSEEENA